MNTEEKIQKFQEILNKATHIVFFTGAGVSTDSGIPDFRSQDGLYNQKYSLPPEEIISHHYFEENPEEFFRFYRDKMIHTEAEPNSVHRFIAQCEKAGKSLGVVTQNMMTYTKKPIPNMYMRSMVRSCVTIVKTVESSIQLTLLQMRKEYLIVPSVVVLSNRMSFYMKKVYLLRYGMEQSLPCKAQMSSLF